MPRAEMRLVRAGGGLPSKIASQCARRVPGNRQRPYSPSRGRRWLRRLHARAVIVLISKVGHWETVLRQMGAYQPAP